MISPAMLDKPALVSFSKISNSTRSSHTLAILRSFKNSLVHVFSKLHLNHAITYVY